MNFICEEIFFLSWLHVLLFRRRRTCQLWSCLKMASVYMNIRFVSETQCLGFSCVSDHMPPSYPPTLTPVCTGLTCHMLWISFSGINSCWKCLTLAFLSFKLIKNSVVQRRREESSSLMYIFYSCHTFTTSMYIYILNTKIDLTLRDMSVKNSSQYGRYRLQMAT